MKMLRVNPPKKVGFENINEIKDYEKGVGDLPKSDVLQLITDKSSVISIRPSGTEPKIKIYFSVIGKNNKDAEEKLKSLLDGFTNVIDMIIKK